MINAIDLYRTARFLHLQGVPVAPRLLRKVLQYLHGSYIPPEAEIGPGCELGYGGLGVIIHPQTRIGRNVFISPQVTLGGRSQLDGAPVVEDNVVIGTGAKILGPIRIGEGARIGANAVVIADVRPGATVAGVPAREIQSRTRPKAEAKRSLEPVTGNV
jgi:serine O-acetyltransferase